MDKRPLGQTGLSTYPLCLGGNVFGWTADRERSFELLDAFVDEGFDLIDTAEVYSAWAPGHQGRRERGGGRRVAARPRAARPGAHRHQGGHAHARRPCDGLSAGRIAEAVEGSLRRLRTDYVDLYLAHKDDAATPLDETLEAFDRLVRAGKVRAIGASNYSGGRLQEANGLAVERGLPRYEVLEPEYSLLARGFEDDQAAYCRDQGVGVITYWGLAGGFLSGKYRSAADVEGKPRARNVAQHLTPRGFAVLDAVEAVARAHATAPAQVALAWVMARPAVTAAIASATSLEQLRDLVAAARLPLTPADHAGLDAASAA